MFRRHRATSAAALSFLLAALVGLPASPAAAFAPSSAQVFVNEIHYDNASTDVGEAIEIAAPAGTDLTGWSIVLYNGSGGAPYNTRRERRGVHPKRLADPPIVIRAQESGWRCS